MFALRTLFAHLWSRPQAGGMPASPAQVWVARAVWGVWLGMTAWVAVFVAKHGHNLPVTDEWAFVPVYYGGWREKLTWLFHRHCEHRFFLGRGIILGLLWITGIDFRVGLWVTVVFLSAASAVLILAARKLRGHTHPVDVIFPLLLLHLGHTENLVMGYQLVFTLTVLYLALFALLIAHSEGLRPATTALLGSVLLVPIALGGGQGLAFVPALGCWVAWQAVRGLRSKQYAAVAVAGVLGLAVVGYFVWIALDQLVYVRGTPIRNGPWETVHVAAQVFGLGVGPLGMYEKPIAGWVMLAADSLVALALLVIVIRRPSERIITGGLLMLLGGVFTFALAIGHARDSGWSSRFAAFSAFGPIVLMLTLARFADSGRRSILWSVVVIALGIAATWANAVHGNRNATTSDVTYHAFRADARAGLPIDLLAERNVRMWDFTPAGWRTLWEHGFPLLAGVPGPYSGPVIPVAFAPDTTPDPNSTLARNCYSVAITPGQEVYAVRAVFRVSAASAWEPLHFEWTDPVSGQLKRSAAAPWVKPGRDESTIFFVNGPVTNGRLFAGREECPIRVLRVEMLPGQQ